MGLIDEFHSNPEIFVFLISTLAGGTGLNLTGLPLTWFRFFCWLLLNRCQPCRDIWSVVIYYYCCWLVWVWAWQILTGVCRFVILRNRFALTTLLRSRSRSASHGQVRWSPISPFSLIEQDRSWRAYRIGQTRPVKVYRLLGAGALEELIYNCQVYKQQQMRIGYEASIQTRYALSLFPGVPFSSRPSLSATLKASKMIHRSGGNFLVSKIYSDSTRER